MSVGLAQTGRVGVEHELPAERSEGTEGSDGDLIGWERIATG